MKIGDDGRLYATERPVRRDPYRGSVTPWPAYEGWVPGHGEALRDAAGRVLGLICLAVFVAALLSMKG